MSHNKKHSIEELYARLPVSIQNLLFSIYGWREAQHRYGSHFKSKLSELKRTEWWSEDRIISYQNQCLRKTLDHAFRSVPFYRERWRSFGCSPEDVSSIEKLDAMPILSKSDVRANSHRLISEDFNRKYLLVGLTSGTTGTPLQIWRTKQANQLQWAVWWRHRARFGLRLGDKFLMFGARLPVSITQQIPPFWRYNRAVNQVYLSTYHIVQEHIEDIAEWLNEEDFDFFTGYPSAMYVLASLFEQHDLRLLNRPKYVVTGSDALLPGFEATIRRVFGVPVTEQYGMAEMCGNMSKCEYGCFHLDFEFGLVELLPIPELGDSPWRRMVFTGFANPAMPFIRYDIGDYAEPLNDRCPCGRKSLAVKRINGRVEEFIRTPDGRRVIGMNQVFEWAPGISEAQIVQTDLHRIEVRVVPGRNFVASSDFHILETELRKRIGFQMLIDFRQVDHIPRASSGKHRAVISTLEAGSQEERELRQQIGDVRDLL